MKALIALIETIVQLLRELQADMKTIHEIQPAVVRFPGNPVEPVHVDIPWILKYMGIGNTTFYAKVRNVLLEPVLRLGGREYYDREEVYDLFRRLGSETGKYRRS